MLIYIYPHTYPGALEKTRGGAKNDVGLGKRVVMVGTGGFSRGSVTKRGHVQNKERGVCLWGKFVCKFVSMGKLSVGGFTHLDTTFGPQLIGGLHLFILDKELAVS